MAQIGTDQTEANSSLICAYLSNLCPISAPTHHSPLTTHLLPLPLLLLLFLPRLVLRQHFLGILVEVVAAAGAADVVLLPFVRDFDRAEAAGDDALRPG